MRMREPWKYVLVCGRYNSLRLHLYTEQKYAHVRILPRTTRVHKAEILEIMMRAWRPSRGHTHVARCWPSFRAFSLESWTLMIQQIKRDWTLHTKTVYVIGQKADELIMLGEPALRLPVARASHWAAMSNGKFPIWGRPAPPIVGLSKQPSQICCARI